MLQVDWVLHACQALHPHHLRATFLSRTLNHNLPKISKWRFQCKMNFNSDPVKQAPEVIFMKKTQKQNHSLLFSNQSAVIQTTFQNGSRLKT